MCICTSNYQRTDGAPVYAFVPGKCDTPKEDNTVVLGNEVSASSGDNGKDKDKSVTIVLGIIIALLVNYVAP